MPWYIDQNETIVGPVSSTELQQRTLRGDVIATTRVSRDQSKWVQASQVKGLQFPPSQRPTPPPLPPAAIRPNQRWATAGAFVIVGAVALVSGVVLAVRLPRRESTPPQQEAEDAVVHELKKQNSLLEQQVQEANQRQEEEQAEQRFALKRDEVLKQMARQLAQRADGFAKIEYDARERDRVSLQRFSRGTGPSFARRYPSQEERYYDEALAKLRSELGTADQEGLQNAAQKLAVSPSALWEVDRDNADVGVGVGVGEETDSVRPSSIAR